jgi:DNA-binding CsgD family transcriptional regulator
LAYIFVFCFATPIKYQKKEGVKFGLTEREMEVLQYLADGLDNREIADKLYLSEGTVKNYISRIYSKDDSKSISSILSGKSTY